MALVDNPRVRAVQPLIAAVYEHHSAGGGLHIVLDDWNLETSHVLWCLENLTMERGGDPPSPARLEAERACGAAFLEMTADEQSSALVLYHYPEHF